MCRSRFVAMFMTILMVVVAVIFVSINFGSAEVSTLVVILGLIVNIVVYFYPHYPHEKKHISASRTFRVIDHLPSDRDDI